MSLFRSSRQYLGVRAIQPPDLQYALRAPTSNDKSYVKGTLWLDTDASTAWMWPGSGSWIALGSGTTGAIVTVTVDSGGAISPVGGNVDVLGDAADGVSVVGTAGTLTINVAAASTTQRGTLETSTDAESVTGTSLLVAVTPASLTARLASPGAIGGTLPAAGTFTNVLVNDVLSMDGGAATDFIGQTTLSSGVATVLNTNIGAGDHVYIERIDVNSSSALGVFGYVITPATSFVISAYDPSDASVQTDDNSIVRYFIVRQV